MATETEQEGLVWLQRLSSGQCPQRSGDQATQTVEEGLVGLERLYKWSVEATDKQEAM